MLETNLLCARRSPVDFKTEVPGALRPFLVLTVTAAPE